MFNFLLQILNGIIKNRFLALIYGFLSDVLLLYCFLEKQVISHAFFCLYHILMLSLCLWFSYFKYILLTAAFRNYDPQKQRNYRILTVPSIPPVRYHYLRGLVNTVSNKRLDALEDFQSLYKTDAEIFPSQLVKSLVDSLPNGERLQVSSES